MYNTVKEIFGKYSYVILKYDEEDMAKGIFASVVIFEKCFQNFLPIFNIETPQQLIADKDMWNGKYDSVIGSRLDVERYIPFILMKKDVKELTKLDMDIDLFAEWVVSLPEGETKCLM